MKISSCRPLSVGKDSTTKDVHDSRTNNRTNTPIRNAGTEELGSLISLQVLLCQVSVPSGSGASLVGLRLRLLLRRSAALSCGSFRSAAILRSIRRPRKRFCAATQHAQRPHARGRCRAATGDGPGSRTPSCVWPGNRFDRRSAACSQPCRFRWLRDGVPSACIGTRALGELCERQK